MYLTRPQPLRTPGTPRLPLYLTAIHRRVFTASGDPNPSLERFTSDLAALYGLAPRAEVLARPHPSYSVMSNAMLRDATADRPADDTPDLIVLAHCVPEVDPRQCASTHLNRVSVGDPFGYGICDQGTAAPFTALTLIGEHMRAGCRRALLIVLEQGEVPYDTPPRTLLPEKDTAVALLIETAGPLRVAAVHQRSAIAPSEVDAAVAAAVAALPPGPPRPAIIGPNRQAPGMLCTAPWWALADALERHAGPHRTIIVDYETSLGYLSVLAVDTDSPHA